VNERRVASHVTGARRSLDASNSESIVVGITMAQRQSEAHADAAERVRVIACESAGLFGHPARAPTIHDAARSNDSR
jgi:hypothetical protein